VVNEIVRVQRLPIPMSRHDRNRRVTADLETVDGELEPIPFLDAVHDAGDVLLHRAPILRRTVRRYRVKIRSTQCHDRGSVVLGADCDDAFGVAPKNRSRSVRCLLIATARATSVNGCAKTAQLTDAVLPLWQQECLHSWVVAQRLPVGVAVDSK
jgi:hypothetical protein